MVSWWSAPGRPGFASGAWLGTAFPWAFAGHALGGIALDEPAGAPGALPGPGVAQARRPLAWSDTLTFEMLPASAWGFDSALLGARAWSRPEPGGHATSTVSLAQGTDAWDENALAVARGDSTRWLRAEVLAGNRGASESLERAGRHLWGLGAGFTRGRSRWSARYAQRGAAGALQGGIEQDVTGESGGVEWSYDGRGYHAGAAVERGDDGHVSQGDGIVPSRRDAGETRARAELLAPALGGVATLTVTGSETRVARAYTDSTVFDRTGRALWVNGSLERAAAGGALEAGLGAGRDDRAGRTVLAPRLAWRGTLGRLGVRVAGERLTRPVWYDLAPDQAPFLQSTWAASAEASAAGPRWRARAGLMTGRTTERAVVFRLPLEDLWLRDGWQADPVRARFVLAHGGIEGHAGNFETGGEGFALGRDRSAIQPNVDPNWGARGWGRWRTRAFQGDLGVAVRLEVTVTGTRQSEEAIPRRLRPFAMSAAALELALADARIVIEARNLEDVTHLETWTDPTTGDLARGPAREVRMVVSLRLLN